MELPNIHNLVWLVDNFEDVKTTLLPEDIAFEQGKQIELSNGEVATCYRRLADVPKDVTALTIGSSGYGPHRLLEVVVGGCGKASSLHGLVIGDPVLDNKGARS